MLKTQISSVVASGDVNNFLDYLKTEGNIKSIVERDSLLHVACKYGQLNMARELIKSGANCGFRHSGSGRIPLHDACIIGNADLLEFLADLSQDYIDTPDNNGLSPAHICVMEGELNCLKILKKSGAEFAVKDKDGMGLIHWAAKRNHSSIIYYLFELEMDINEQCSRGKTPLHYAAIYNSTNAIKALIRCKADTTLKDKEECSSIHLAAKHGSLECLRYLASTGIPVDIKQVSGKTPTHYAAFQGFNECLHWLLDNGADISITDDKGNTIGHYACQGGHGEVIHCYLSHDGSTEPRNNLDETLIQTARRYGHPVKLEMARNSEIVCSICQLETNKRKWNQIHVPPSAVQAMIKAQKNLFRNPLGSWRAGQSLWRTIVECWDRDAEARLSSSCVYERLLALYQKRTVPSPTGVRLTGSEPMDSSGCAASAVSPDRDSDPLLL